MTTFAVAIIPATLLFQYNLRLQAYLDFFRGETWKLLSLVIQRHRQIITDRS